MTTVNEEFELIPHEPIDPRVLFLEGKGIVELLEKIRTRAFEYGQDVSTEKGRALVKSIAYQISRGKTTLLDMGNKAIEEEKKIVAKGSKNKKIIEVYLSDLKTDYRKPLTDFEEAEKRKEEERLERVKVKIDKLKSITEDLSFETPLTHLTEALRILQEWEIEPEEYFEFTPEAETEKSKAVGLVEKAIENQKKRAEEEATREAEEDRLEKIRMDQEEAQKKIDAENARIASEKREIEEAKAKLEAEKQAEIDRKKREELEKREAEERRIKAEKDAKEAAEQKERDQLEREKAEIREKARIERLKPDKEKLSEWILFFDKIENNQYPILGSDEANKALQKMTEMLGELLQKFDEMVEEL